MKRISLLIMLLYILISCTGCGKSPEEKIIGYWVSSDGKSSLSFDDKGIIVVDEEYIGEYAVFDEEKIAIDVDTPIFDDVYDIAMSAEFQIQDGILNITDLKSADSYTYYSNKKAETLENKEYKERSESVPYEQYMALTLSWPDDWELFLEGTELEGLVDKKTLEQDSQKAIELAKKEIVSLYINSMIDGKNAFTYSCVSAALVWDEVCYEISVHCKYDPENDCEYYVNPNNGDIYSIDEEEFLVLWDGTIKGSSILEYI